jgi:DNA adenine methylase
MKTPLTYYGGKQMMARRIINLIPQHRTYIEPFAGGAAVFFAKEPSDVEVLNDTNGELMNFYRVCLTDFDKLEAEIKATLHSREIHRQAYVVYNNPDMFTGLKRAWAIWVLSAQGFGGMIDGSWGYDIRTKKSNNTINSRKRRFTSELAERLEHCQLDCKDALHIIRKYDTPESFFYVDPPYYNSDMGHYDVYTSQDFENLLATLSAIKGRFILSSYPSGILEDHINQHGWHSKSFEGLVSVNAKSGNQKRKVECLTANYDINNNHYDNE